MTSPNWSFWFVAKSGSTLYPSMLTIGLVAVGLVAQLGCREDTTIRQYRVAKGEAGRSGTPAAIGSSAMASPSSGSTATGKEQQMLAAIVPNQDFAWFFKLTGDPEKVVESDADFRQMVKSVQFDGSGQPTWKLSEGWQQQITPNDITYGKLTHGDAGLTATVTRLPFTSSPTEDSWRGYIVSNINRWRNQLSLDTQDWAAMAGQLEEFPELSQGPAKAYYVSLSGRGSGGMSAPFMNRPSGPTAQPPAADAASGSRAGNNVATSPPAPNAAVEPSGERPPSPKPKPAIAASPAPTAIQGSSAKPISYQVPQGWQEIEASGMRMAAFNVVAGDGDAVAAATGSGEVTVIAAGGGIEANIGIWLGQVGLEATPELTEKILAAAEELSVQSLATRLYTIAPDLSPESVASDNTAAQAILIADIPWREGQSLFVKFKGDAEVASAQRQKFSEFVESMQWTH